MRIADLKARKQESGIRGQCPAGSRQKEIRSQPPSLTAVAEGFGESRSFRLRYNFGGTSRRAKEVGSQKTEDRRQRPAGRWQLAVRGKLYAERGNRRSRKIS